MQDIQIIFNARLWAIFSLSLLSHRDAQESHCMLSCGEQLLKSYHVSITPLLTCKNQSSIVQLIHHRPCSPQSDRHGSVLIGFRKNGTEDGKRDAVLRIEQDISPMRNQTPKLELVAVLQMMVGQRPAFDKANDT